MTDPFESLRGRARPAATPSDAVDAVIAAGRRRRLRAVVGGGAGTALLVGVLVVALTGGGGAPQTLDIVDDPTPSVEASEEPTESATSEPSASASESAAPTSSEEPGGTATTAGPSPSESDDADYWTRTFNDGKPGWSGGFSGCTVGDDREDTAVGRTISVETALPRSAWRPGEPLQAYVVITNNGKERREVDASAFETRGVLRNMSGAAVSAVHFTDAVRPVPIVLDPGESRRVVAEANTVTCGDGPEDAEPKLAAGTYSLVFRMGQDLGRTPPVEVRLDPGASTVSAWPMQPRPKPWTLPSGHECVDNRPTGVDVPGFTMTVESPTNTGPRTDVKATVVVTATADDVVLQTDPRSSPVLADGATPASSTGFDAGPFPDETSTTAPSDSRDDMPRLKAGDSLRYPVIWSPYTCPQQGAFAALPPGNYDVSFGLFVADDAGERDYWMWDDTVTITVTG